MRDLKKEVKDFIKKTTSNKSFEKDNGSKNYELLDKEYKAFNENYDALIEKTESLFLLRKMSKHFRNLEKIVNDKNQTKTGRETYTNTLCNEE